MKKFISVMLCLCFVISMFGISINAQSDGLRFNSSGGFTVLQITDPQDDRYTAYELPGFIEKAIAATDPDFIVLTGDIVEDSRAGDVSTDDEKLREGVKVDGDYAATLENTKAAVAGIFAPIEASGIPYAITQGNNDYNSGVTNEDWLEIYAEYPGCVTDDYCDMLSGKMDYYVPVLGADGEPAFGLWMLDNGRGFDENQLHWFNSYEIGAIPSVVFEHAPVDDVGNLFEQCKPWDEGAIINGAAVNRLNDQLALGHAEEVSEFGVTTAQFTSWKEKGVVGAFFGHLHTSGYTGVWDGITLGLTYGCQFAKAGPYGARTIVLDEESGTIETELYEYSDGEIKAQSFEPYKEYDNSTDKILAAIINFFKNIFNAIKYAVKA